ncbi:MAG: hypothetical protein EA398_03170 [Deltaproteobacteria bacterium]|nr:MAG: hypothetical protein EA398_03170 [Deltaproteobacteria bacterium]
MNPSGPIDEHELETGCVEGQIAAIDAANAYLSSPHPYTRARAAEMLSVCPDDALRSWWAGFLARRCSPETGWLVLALRAADLGALPELDGLADALEGRIREEPGGDEASHLLSLAEFLPPARAVDALRLLASHPDTEVAVEAAWILDERDEPLGDELLDRLESVRGPAGAMASVVCADAGRAGALEHLVELVRSEHFLAATALDVLERRGERAHGEALRPTWDRFFASFLSARAAATSAVLGVPDARARLERLARSWRSAVRHAAAAELLRLAPAENVRAWAPATRGQGVDAVAVACEALGRRADSAAFRSLKEVVESDGREPVLLAAVEALCEPAFGDDGRAWVTAWAARQGDADLRASVHRIQARSARQVARRSPSDIASPPAIVPDSPAS